MDSYLESLNKKEIKEEEVIEEAVEETVDEPVEETVEEETVEEPVEEAVEEEPVEEIVEPEVEEVVEPEPVVEPKKEVKKAAPVSNGTTTVTDIRVFNVPDTSTPMKLISGNIIVKGEVAGLSKIEYMKPGFGLVTGFTPDLR